MTTRRGRLKWTPAEREELLNRFRDGQGHIQCRCCEKLIHEEQGQVVSIEHDPPWHRRKEILHSMPSFQNLSAAEKQREEIDTYRYGYCEPVHMACHRDKDGRGAPSNPIMREMINCNEEPDKIRQVAPSCNPKSPFLRDCMHNIDVIDDWVRRFSEPPKWTNDRERNEWREGLKELEMMKAGFMTQLEVCFDKSYEAIRASWDQSHASRVVRDSGDKKRG